MDRSHMTPRLIADCVSKTFGERRVLSAGSLRAMSGELRALLGRNGAGKSTLLKIAAGWIQPDGGQVTFDGRVYQNPKLPTLAAQGLFYLPDHDLFSSAYSVRSQLEMFRRQFDGGDVDAAAESAGIAGRIDARPYDLSGGERRRAEIAAILVRRPTCLLADEPYRGIAPRDAEDMTRLFRELASAGTAVVITGHEVPTLLAAADHVTWCTSGTTHELGPPATAVTNDAFRREYLGTSYSSRIANGS
jgi:lipopolysaccharide export system ATP-binding protein